MEQKEIYAGDNSEVDCGCPNTPSVNIRPYLKPFVLQSAMLVASAVAPSDQRTTILHADMLTKYVDMLIS